LVKWESTTNEEILGKAREEIRKSWREVCELNKDHPEAATLFNPEKMPGLHDPFAGGGTIPLEAQRLGLEAYASDLNPVAVLINKAMIEIPPKFAGMPPVHPDARKEKGLFKREWKGAEGLAEDVRRYGAWMREEAEKRIGHLYPKVKITKEMVAKRPDLKSYEGQELTVIAWLWARTVKSPNPAFSHVDVPLVSNFVLASTKGREAWLEPIISGSKYRFEVRLGVPPAAAFEGTKALGRGANFKCLLSGSPIDGDYIKAEGQSGRLGARLLAVVLEGRRTRIYLHPDAKSEALARSAPASWRPSGEIPQKLTGGTCVPYGMKEWGDLFTTRQLLALSTFSDIVGEARELAREHAVELGVRDDRVSLELGGSGACAYGEAIATYLAFCVDKNTLTNTTLATWQKDPDRLTQAFSRQAIAMTWDYAEANPLSEAGGGFVITARAIGEVLERLRPSAQAGAVQVDARRTGIERVFVSTDPPYYDNIAYADLSDYFYVWLRRSLRMVFPSLFLGISVPKEDELVAAAHRHGSKKAAEQYFLQGMSVALVALITRAHPGSPLSIYYAFKQSETKEGAGTSSAGWETFLQAVLDSGLALVGTWPMRTELIGSLKKEVNALASSVVLVCRKRSAAADTIARREFIREINAVLPKALDAMTKGSGSDQSPVAPVDLSQAIIGPGMAVFSKYAAVLEADGTPMTVKTALQLINRFLAEDDFDADTQFCLHWFDQHGWDHGAYGDADVLARAKATAVGGLVEAGVVVSGGGKVRLLRPAEYPDDWDPRTDKRLPVWEALHQLIRVFRKDGETGAGRVLAAVKEKTEAIRQLAYRLYTLCERPGWAEDARGYNELVTAWSAIETAANVVPEQPKKTQLSLFGGNQ
jgi:putative DNA methylase